MQGKIFISYRRAANAWAIEKLREELTGAFGEKNLFLDKVTISGGDDWDSRIDEAIRTAAVVIVVFSREWFGDARDTGSSAAPRGPAPPAGQTPPPVARRIDNPQDKLRIEVEMAGKHGRPVIPVIIDDSPEPRAEELPESVRFLTKKQFLRLNVGGNTEQQLERLVGDIRGVTSGSDWAWRLAGQALWISLLTVSLVFWFHERGGSDVYQTAFARAVLSVRDKLAVEAPSIVVAEMNELEYRELFGGRAPLDPELTTMVLRRLRNAASRCDAALPVVINLDIAPTTEDGEQGHQAAMTQALVELARCRPVVLACPAAIRRGSEAWYESRWMNDVLERARDKAGKGVVFATGTADPEGLRRAQGRSEMGVAAADLARGRRVFHGHEQRHCICPLTPEIAESCAGKPVETEWHPRAFAVPLPGSSQRRTAAPADSLPVSVAMFTAAVAKVVQDDDPPIQSFVYGLHEALVDAEDVMKADAVLIGTNRGQARYAVPGRPRKAFEGVSSTVVQAHLLNSAMNHEPVRGQPIMVLMGVALSWLVAATILFGGRELDRNNDRFAYRGFAYLLFPIALLSVPLGAVVMGAIWPGSIWWLGLLCLAAILAASRAVLGCFEIVLCRGLSWRWPAALYRELLHGSAKSSAALRLLTFTLEGALIVLCFGFALYWHWLR